MSVAWVRTLRHKTQGSPEEMGMRPSIPSRPAPRRRWVGFALPAVLFVLAVFVLHGPIAGVAALATMLTFIAACIHVLRGHAVDDRSALGGWVGGWF
jgi:hypothetical protein